MNKQLARVLLISAGLIWGLGFVINKRILDFGWDESQLLFVRFMTATIIIFVVFFKRIIQSDGTTIKSGLFLGVFLYLGFFFQTWGLVYTTPSNNALITAGYIIILPFIVWAIEKRSMSEKTLLASITTLAGIVLITVDFQELTIAAGDLLTFIGAFFYGFHIYFLGKKAKEKDPVVLMAFQLLMFSLIATIVMFLRSGLPEVSIESRDSMMIFLLAIAVGFFASFLGFVFQSIGQKHTNAAEAAILISTESLFGPAFAILFYGDPFNLYIFFGILLVTSGIVLSELEFFQKDRFRLH